MRPTENPSPEGQFTLSRLSEFAIPNLRVREAEPLSLHTRFDIGGPAEILADAATPDALAETIRALKKSGIAYAVIGGGSNLVASDEGFPGVVLRYVEDRIVFDSDASETNSNRVQVTAGTSLQRLVDETIAHGLRGLETMTGIPGWVGGAVYGNAGAYGHSIHERIESVRFFDGEEFREIGNAACEFAYRESIFKRSKNWIIVSAILHLDPADAVELAATAGGIREIRDAKYPPSMRCAGSIFKNLLWRELPAAVQSQIPEKVIREGKVPSAYFLEQAGAKGRTNGPVHVADYHANLIYNTGGGTAQQVRTLVDELKRRVQEQFGIELEEEVQYLG